MATAALRASEGDVIRTDLELHFLRHRLPRRCAPLSEWESAYRVAETIQCKHAKIALLRTMFTLFPASAVYAATSPTPEWADVVALCQGGRALLLGV